MSLAIYQQNKVLKSDPFCLSLPELSRYRSHIFKRAWDHQTRPATWGCGGLGSARNDAQAAAFGAREESDAGESRSEICWCAAAPPSLPLPGKSKGRVCGPRPWAAARREAVRGLRADTWGMVSTGGAQLLCRGALSVRPVFFCQRGFSLPAHFWRHFSTKGLYVINCWTLRGPGEVSLSLMSSWTNRRLTALT